MFHQNMDARVTGAPLPFLLEASPEREWPNLIAIVVGWDKPDNWNIIGSELALEAPILSNSVLRGRLDVLIEKNGGLWSVQWKTLAKGKNLENHTEKVRLSYHEIAYQWLVEQNRDKLPFVIRTLPFKGTILGTAIKHTKARGDTTELILTYLPRSRNEQAQGLLDIKAIITDMQGSAHMRNLNECIDPIYGKCQYHDVCHAGCSINDPPYISLDDRYKDLR